MSYDWFEKIGDPKYVVAPMVDASELAFRLLTRRHGAKLCYSPMFHSNVFTKDPKYRKDCLQSTKEDRPLIIQFCGNDPKVMAAAGKFAEDHCDAIDINLGCPQAIAKRGKYGSFLQDDWDLLKNIISSMTEVIAVPITCKVRVFECIEKTVQYALMLQEAGCKLLTVHGRTREQKGPLTGIANWEHIKAVRQAVSIPVYANGNIQCLEDVHRCLNYTNVDGVMSAEGILTNPSLFNGINAITWVIAEEYLALVEQHPCPSSYIRGHLFKIFHKIFVIEDNNECRQLLATGKNLNDFKQVAKTIKEKYLPYHEGDEQLSNCENITRQGYDLILPPWICQPYVRMPPEKHKEKMEMLNKLQDQDNYHEKTNEDSTVEPIPRKRMKKIRRIMRRPIKSDTSSNSNHRSGDICINTNCPNPLGGKCLYKLCRKCCRNKCYEGNLDCRGHGILVKTRREMAKKYAAMQYNANNVIEMPL